MAAEGNEISWEAFRARRSGFAKGRSTQVGALLHVARWIGRGFPAADYSIDVRSSMEEKRVTLCYAVARSTLCCMLSLCFFAQLNLSCLLSVTSPFGLCFPQRNGPFDFEATVDSPLQWRTPTSAQVELWKAFLPVVPYSQGLMDTY